jgi:hypothetical protein
VSHFSHTTGSSRCSTMLPYTALCLTPASLSAAPLIYGNERKVPMIGVCLKACRMTGKKDLRGSRMSTIVIA